MEVIYRATSFNHGHADEIGQAGAGGVQRRTTTMSRCNFYFYFEGSFTLLLRQLSKPASGIHPPPEVALRVIVNVNVSPG